MLQLNEATVPCDSLCILLFVTPDLSLLTTNAVQIEGGIANETKRNNAIREFCAASSFWMAAVLELCQEYIYRRRWCCSALQTFHNNIQRWLPHLVDSFAYHNNMRDSKWVWTEDPSEVRLFSHGQRYAHWYPLLSALISSDVLYIEQSVPTYSIKPVWHSSYLFWLDTYSLKADIQSQLTVIFINLLKCWHILHNIQ